MSQILLQSPHQSFVKSGFIFLPLPYFYILFNFTLHNQLIYMDDIKLLTKK